MDIPISMIGEKLKKIRTSRNLSLDDVAGLTEVSKPMLGQIERGQSIPTITTLWKIATGLKTPLSAFLEQHQTEYSVTDIEANSSISESDGKMRAYPLVVYEPIRNMEVFYIEFEPACQHKSDSHNEGVEEYVFVISGCLNMVLDGKEIVLKEKQAIRFRADIPHEYNNPYEQKCTAHNIIFYPNH